MSAEGIEVAEELSRLPKELREQARDAILRLVLVYQAKNDSKGQLALPLTSKRGPTKVDGNLYQPRVESWSRKARAAAKRRRAT